MSYIYNNPNPDEKFVGDCTVRALSIALDQSWDNTYMDICAQGAMMHDMPSSNDVWGYYLMSKGFDRHLIEKECKTCYKLKDFCEDHPEGTFVVSTGTHAVAVINGDYYDTGDSGRCIPIFYYEKKEEISE